MIWHSQGYFGNPVKGKFPWVYCWRTWCSTHFFLFVSYSFTSFLKYNFIDFKKRGKEKGGEKESLIGCLTHTPYLGSHPQPGYAPWRGSNHWPLRAQEDTQPTEILWPGLHFHFGKFLPAISVWESLQGLLLLPPVLIPWHLDRLLLCKYIPQCPPPKVNDEYERSKRQCDSSQSVEKFFQSSEI